MNREIQELREVITKLVPLLTGRGLKVTQRGTKAYVRANARTNKPEVVNIPSIPDNASPDFISAVSGFVDHEVGHVLFTDWSFYGGDGVAVSKQSEEGQALTRTHNLIEDTMIEREIVKTFPGSERNLEKLHKHFLEKITLPELAKVKGNEKIEFAYLVVPMVRAMSGQAIFQEFMDTNGFWKHPMIEMLHMSLSDEALDMLKKARTTKETLEVAQEIHDIMFHGKKRKEEEEEKKPEPPKAKQPPPKKGKSQDKPEQQAGAGDGTGERKHDEDADGEASEADDDGNGQAAEQASGSGSSKSSEEEAEEAGAEGEEGEADGDGEASEDEADGAGASGDEKGEDGEGKDEADGDGSGEETDDADEEGDGAGGEAEDEKSEDDGEDGVKSEADDEAEEQDDGEGIGENGVAEEEEEYSDISGSKTGGDDEAEAQGGGGAGGEAGKSMFDLDPADFKPLDLSSAISQQIEKMATEAVGNSDYSVFTKDEDRIEPLTVDEKYVKDDWVPKLEEAVSGMIGPMQKDIERLMAAQSLSVRTAGHRTGRLHSPSLYRVLQGDPKVFARKEEHRTRDTAVMLLVDNSGSMHGDRCVVAMQAAYALGQTLERVNIANEILGFTTGGLSSDAYNQLSAEQGKGVRFHRSHSIIMPIYKHFAERMTPLVKKRIAYQINVQSGMNTNTDGESLEYAALRLLPRREKRKVMLVMSDGQPVGNNSGWHLRDTVKKLTKMGVETVGIGIQSNAVQQFYDRSMVLNRVADLPAAVMGELKRILTK